MWHRIVIVKTKVVCGKCGATIRTNKTVGETAGCSRCGAVAEIDGE